MANSRFCLSIGTGTIALASIDAKEILIEKNVIAVKDNKFIVACGDEAYEMFEKAPENIQVSFPVDGGVISDLKKMSAVLETMYKRLNNGKLIKGSEFLIAVPTDATEVEKRAFHELVLNSKIKPRGISVVEKCIADAVTCGIEPTSPKGILLINIGADTTEIAVISMGGIVLDKTLKFGGNRFDELIMSFIRQSEGRQIGKRSAEQLKFNLADLTQGAPDREMKVFGREVASGLPVRTEIHSGLVNSVIEDQLDIIIEDTMRILEKTPYEIELDIRDAGIYLMGGSAAITGIKEFFESKTGIKTNLLKDPGNSTIKGLVKIFSSSKYDSIRYFPEEKVYN